MRYVLISLRRVAWGIALGEAFLVLAVLDVLRARAMADVTGNESLESIAPFAQIMSFVSQPVWQAVEPLFGQDPIALFALLIAYWAVLGVLAFYLLLLVKYLVLMVKQLLARRGQ